MIRRLIASLIIGVGTICVGIGSCWLFPSAAPSRWFSGKVADVAYILYPYWPWNGPGTVPEPACVYTAFVVCGVLLCAGLFLTASLVQAGRRKN